MKESTPAAQERGAVCPRPPFLPPPPEPGLSPTIFGREMPARDKWFHRVLTLVLFNSMTLIGLTIVLDGDLALGQRTGAAFVALMFLAMSIQSIRGSERNRLRAGRDWLSEDGREYVKLDRLELVEAFTNGGAGTYVRFIDLDGRGLNFAASELQRNPMLHRIVVEAVHGNERHGRQVFESPAARERFFKETELYVRGPESDTHL